MIIYIKECYVVNNQKLLINQLNSSNIIIVVQRIFPILQKSNKCCLISMTLSERTQKSIKYLVKMFRKLVIKYFSKTLRWDWKKTDWPVI